MSTATWDVQCLAPYTMLYADNITLDSHKKVNLDQFLQKWNVHRKHQGLRLNLNKTKNLTTDPNETFTAIASDMDLQTTEQFK